MNGKYIAAMPIDILYETLGEYLQAYHPAYYENTFSTHEESYNKAVLQEIQKRLETLEDYISLTDFFYREPEIDAVLLLSEKMGITDLSQAQEALIFALDIIKSFGKTPNRDETKNTMIPKIAEAGKKNGQILWPLRVALTGKEFSPGAFEMIEIL